MADKGNSHDTAISNCLNACSVDTLMLVGKEFTMRSLRPPNPMESRLQTVLLRNRSGTGQMFTTSKIHEVPAVGTLSMAHVGQWFFDAHLLLGRS